MKITTRIRLNLTQDVKARLLELIETASLARRAAASRMWRSELVARDVSKFVREEYGLHSRQGESIRIEILALRGSWREGIVSDITAAKRELAVYERYAYANKAALDDARKSHAKLGPTAPCSNRIAKLKEHLFQNRMRRDACTARVIALTKLLSSDKPRICFGGAELLRRRSGLNPNDGTHEYARWLEDWDLARNRQMVIVGSSAEKLGNLSCSLDPSTWELAVRMPLSVDSEARTKRSGKARDLLVVPNVKFPERSKADFERAIEEGQSIQMRLLKVCEPGAATEVELHVCFEKKSAPVAAPTGAFIGVHMGQRELSWSAVTTDGNDFYAFAKKRPTLLASQTSSRVPFKGRLKMSGDTAAGTLFEMAGKLCRLARESGLGVALPSESYLAYLDACGISGSSAVLPVVSHDDYSRFYALIRRRSEEFGFPIVMVEIGDSLASGPIKYGRRGRVAHGVSVAFAIGRKAALGNRKRSPRSTTKRRKDQIEYFERVAFPKPMLELEPLRIKGQPRGVAWKAILRRSEETSGGRGLASSDHRGHSPPSRARGRFNAAPQAGNSERVVPGNLGDSGAPDPRSRPTADS